MDGWILIASISQFGKCTWMKYTGLRGQTTWDGDTISTPTLLYVIPTKKFIISFAVHNYFITCSQRFALAAAEFWNPHHQLAHFIGPDITYDVSESNQVIKYLPEITLTQTKTINILYCFSSHQAHDSI